jgi:hypothetical protein
MAETLDYKKEYKDLYFPKNQPSIIDVPEMAFVAVQGKGDPNEENGEYQQAVGLLYAIQYTIKMSKKGKNTPDGFFDYVVPPLEGLWWFEGNGKIQPKDKSKYNWLSIIRLPEFVNKKVFEWACKEVHVKKKLNIEKATFYKLKEGLCVQCMHTGPYDDEPKTLELMEDFIEKNGLLNDINETRRHHEIYLSDPRKTDQGKLKTILRIPVRK